MAASRSPFLVTVTAWVGLFEGGDGDLVGDVHRDAGVDHRQRRELLVFGDEQPGGAGRAAGGRGGEDQQREGVAQDSHDTPPARDTMGTTTGLYNAPGP